MATPQQQQPPKLGGLSLDPDAIMAAVGVKADQRENMKNQSCCCKAVTGLVCLLCCPVTCPILCCVMCCGACCAAKAARNGGGAKVGEGWTGEGQAQAMTNESQPGRVQ